MPKLDPQVCRPPLPGPQRLLCGAMERSKNDAALPAYIKVVQGAMKRLDPDQYNTTDMERFCDVHEEVMVDLLNISASPTRVLLKKAAKVVFQVPPRRRRFFGQSRLWLPSPSVGRRNAR